MKKLVFSAMALLAFTATSFAAEGKKEVKKAEVKTEVKKTEIKTTLKINLDHNVCTYVGMVAALKAIRLSYDQDLIDLLRDSAEDTCESVIGDVRDSFLFKQANNK